MGKITFILLSLMFSVCDGAQTNVFQNSTGGQTYYHILLSLTPTNSSLSVPSSYNNPMYRTETAASFDPSGLFEVYVRCSAFPVPSPNCDGGWIILRMAATTPDVPDAKAKIAEKRALWDRLQNIYKTGSGSIQVVVELNPYVRVIDPSVPKLELEYCNVFFRQAFGAYVPYIGPLKEGVQAPRQTITFDSPEILETPSFTITIQSQCPEGYVECDDVKYVGVSKKTHKSMTLTGSTYHTRGPDGVTPAHFLGYLFKNGDAQYFVGSDGTLEVNHAQHLSAGGGSGGSTASGLFTLPARRSLIGSLEHL